VDKPQITTVQDEQKRALSGNTGGHYRSSYRIRVDDAIQIDDDRQKSPQANKVIVKIASRSKLGTSAPVHSIDSTTGILELKTQELLEQVYRAEGHQREIQGLLQRERWCSRRLWMNG
jgi:hypothetical protein